jgi:hypothetical protein
MQLLALLATALAACGGGATNPPAESDAGPGGPDSAIAADASSAPADATIPPDAGLRPDAAAMDAGPAPAPDAASMDAGTALPPLPDASAPDASFSRDSGSGLLPSIPATQGTLSAPFQVAITGDGTDRLGAISIVENAGDLQFNGNKHVGFVYYSHDWTSANYTLYDFVTLADDGSDLAVTYLYCQDSGLPYAYSESLLNPMALESTTGTCASLSQTTDVSVTLPALQVTPQPFNTGIAISGADLSLGSAGGTVALGADSYSVVPFNTVDCTSCPGGPWYEIHSMLMRADTGCFAILYLFPDDPTYVEIEYTICLPSLTQPEATYYYPWTGTLLARRSLATPPMPMPALPRPAPRPPGEISEAHGTPR